MFGKFLVHAWSRCAGWNEGQSILIGSLGTKLILAPLGMLQCVWPSMNRYKKVPYSNLHTNPQACTENLLIYRKDLYAKQPIHDQNSG